MISDRLLGQWLTAAPLFFSLFAYRKLHLQHHRDPLAADDPDITLTGGYPMAWRKFAFKLLRDISGVSYFKFIQYFVYLARRPKPKSDRTERHSATQGEAGVLETLQQQAAQHREKMPMAVVFGSMVAVNGVLCATVVLAGHGWLYLGLWLLPMMTVLQVLLRIRGIAEHAGYSPGRDQRYNARTVINPLQTWWFAPHKVAYHIEHHVYPSVPFHRLPELHRCMNDRGELPQPNVFTGYGAVLRSVLR